MVVGKGMPEWVQSLLNVGVAVKGSHCGLDSLGRGVAFWQTPQPSPDTLRGPLLEEDLSGMIADHQHGDRPQGF